MLCIYKLKRIRVRFFIDSPIDTLTKLLPANNSNPSRISIPPEEGLLISFPAFVKHGSFIYNSDKRKEYLLVGI